MSAARVAASRSPAEPASVRDEAAERGRELLGQATAARRRAVGAAEGAGRHWRGQ